MIKIAGLVAAFVVAIGLAFYGGRTYQNNIDQPLFTAYNPPKTTAGGGFRSSSFFGSAATGGGGQVAAALALATPPTSGGQLGGTGAASTTSSKKARGTASSAAGKTNKASGASGTAGARAGGSGSGAVPGAGGTPAAGATATDVAGTLQSIDGRSVKVKTAQGAVQSVSLAASTTYYLAESASASALKVGQKVTLGLQPNSSGGFGAGSITIAPPGTLYGYVRPVAAGTATGAGGAGAGGGGGFGFSLAATITAVSGNSITATNATGRSFTIAVKSTTPIYQLVPVAGTKLIMGAAVSVHAIPASGKLVAENVVASNLHGMVASLTAQQARRRAGGFGGAGGGGGFGGGAAGGSSGG
jgi:hypothetical protein